MNDCNCICSNCNNKNCNVLEIFSLPDFSFYIKLTLVSHERYLKLIENGFSEKEALEKSSLEERSIKEQRDIWKQKQQLSIFLKFP